MDIVSAFDELMAELSMHTVSIKAEVVEKALGLQTQSLSLKAVDSL